MEKYTEKRLAGPRFALAETDPEFGEFFSNFAFDEVACFDDLDDRTRFMAILAALLGCQGGEAFRVMLPAALDVGVSPVEVKEIVYQGTAYLGIGRVLPFLRITNEVLQANIATFQTDEPLSKAELGALVALADEETKKGGLPCTACRYCTSHCPQALPIPELIALYNEHKITGGGFIAPMGVASMPAEKRPANCVGCRGCEQVCPQQIKISEAMKEFSGMIGT